MKIRIKTKGDSYIYTATWNADGCAFVGEDGCAFVGEDGCHLSLGGGIGGTTAQSTASLLEAAKVLYGYRLEVI